MSFKENRHLDLNSIALDFYREIDSAVVENNDYLKQMQRNCMEQANPFACYFTVLLGKRPEITWRHNTGKHFGIVDLKYKDAFSLVHPSWLFSHLNFTRMMYEIVSKHPQKIGTGAAASILIPLLHRSGKYYWYHQISVRVANDGDKMAAHLNYYHRSTVYTGQLPSMPVLTTFGEEDPVLTSELNRLSLEFLPGFLAQFLSEAQVSFMLQYRKIIAAGIGEKFIQSEILDQVDGVRTVNNLNKIKHRIKKNVIDHFQHPSLNSAESLAIWLNRYFPLMG